MQKETDRFTLSDTGTYNYDLANMTAPITPPVTHDVYMDMADKLKYELAKAQMKLEKKKT
jgi:hypothetical protein